MAVSLRFEFFGEQQVDRRLEGFEARSRDMRPAWDELRDRFVAYEEDWFASEGRGGWAPLSPDYARWKATHFPGEPILRREHTLYDSLMGPDVDVREPAFAMFGTSDPVAAYHQRGDGNHLPIRRVIDVDDTERAEWARVVQRHLVEEDRQ